MRSPPISVGSIRHGIDRPRSEMAAFWAVNAKTGHFFKKEWSGVCAVADLVARDGVVSSYLSDAAIDEQLDTVDIACGVGGEEQHRIGDFLGLPDTACRNSADHA